MFVTLVCIISLVGIYLWHRKRPKSTEYPLPPALFGELPIIGHAHHLLVDPINLHQVMIKGAEYCNKHGGVIHFKLGNLFFYALTDPDDVLTVANTCLQKSYIYDFGKNWLGEGLITASVPTWQRHRKLLSPAFSLPVVHGFLEIFNSQAKVLIHNLEPHVGETAFKLSPYIKNAILTISCMTVFGNNEVNDKHFYSKYMKAFEEILHILCHRGVTFYLHPDILNTLFGSKKRENELVRIINELTTKAIKKKQGVSTQRVFSRVSHESFLDIILEHLNKNNLTEQEIVEELNTLAVASYESSAIFLEIAAILLGSYPDVQDKVYKEIKEVVGENNDVTKENLQKLVYTEAVIKECLRYSPVAPVMLRYIDKDVKLKNYTLRANSQCIILLNGMHRHPCWGPDVNQFKPERWLDPASIANNSKAFAAFSLGKRSCIGKMYAMTSSKVALVHLLRTFKITADYTKIKFKFDVTLSPVEGNECILERRH